MKEKSFRTYISRLLKANLNGIHINRTTVEAIDSIIRIFADKIVERALVITKSDSKKTISEKELRTAVEVLFANSGFSYTSMVAFATQAVNRYKSNEKESKEAKAEEKEREEKEKVEQEKKSKKEGKRKRKEEETKELKENKENKETKGEKETKGDKSAKKGVAPTEKATNSEKKVVKSQTRESKCGLVLSVSACEKYIRKFGQVGYNVSAGSSVFLAGVLEHFITQILQASAKISQTCGKITITVRHLHSGLKECNLLEFMERMGIMLLDSSVEAEGALKKGKKGKVSRSKSENNKEDKEDEETEAETRDEKGEKKKRRFKPGTRTIMKIKQLQKGNGLLMQHAPFNRIVREIVDEVFLSSTQFHNSSTFDSEEREKEKNDKTDKVKVDVKTPSGDKGDKEKPDENGKKTYQMRITADFFTFFQSFLEERTIRLLKYANNIAEHSGRETLYDKDIALARTILGLGREDGKLNELVPEAALRHMSLRAGVTRYGEDCSAELRGFVIWLLRNHLNDIVLCSLHHRIQTLNVRLLLEGMSLGGVYLTVTSRRRDVKSVGAKKEKTEVGDGNKEVEMGGIEDKNHVPAEEDDEEDELSDDE